MMPPEWRPPTLTTHRLTLRPFTEADARPLYPLASNPNVTNFTLWDAHRSLADTMTYVRDYAMQRYREGTLEPYAIAFTPDPLHPIGACGCFWVSRPNQTMELGYWVGEPFWGLGIAVEASRAVIDLTFQKFEPARLQARVIVGNRASSRVLEKLGFLYEGTLRAALFRRGKLEDIKLYSMLRAEWEGNPVGVPGSS